MEELLQQSALKIWSKNIKDKVSGLKILFNHRAKMCSLAAQGKWSKILKINKKKFIYLISPNKIIKNFYKISKSIKNKKSLFFSNET